MLVNETTRELSDGKAWDEVEPYQHWILQLYGEDILAQFGSFTVFEEGLLLTGIFSMLKECRYKMEEQALVWICKNTDLTRGVPTSSPYNERSPLSLF